MDMITLILTVIFGLGFAYFATQNTSLVTIKLSSYIFTIPLYLLSLGSLLLGLLISGLIHLVDSIASWLTISGKESRIKESEKTIEMLKERIYQLELENSKLESDTETVEEHVVETEKRPRSILDRVRLIMP